MISDYVVCCAGARGLHLECFVHGSFWLKEITLTLFYAFYLLHCCKMGEELTESETSVSKTRVNDVLSEVAVAEKSDKTAQNTYIIRPNFSQKFRPVNVKEMIHTVLGEKLTGVVYSADETTGLTKTIADTIKSKLKDMGHERYKFIVQVVIGEQRGEGVKMGCRCFWDSDTDNYAQDIFMNESLFCVAAAYGVFKY